MKRTSIRPIDHNIHFVKFDHLLSFKSFLSPFIGYFGVWDMPSNMATSLFPYFCHGEVVKGFGRGSKELGIPTGESTQDYSNERYSGSHCDHF